MPITNKLQFIYQEKTTRDSTRGTDWTQQGTLLDGSKMTPGHEYVMVGWVNCTSPVGNEGGTKFAFEDGGGDIVGSVHQRHDTNSSGMYVAHIGQFTAPNPTQSICIYRKMIFDDGGTEETNYGQCFAIDLSYSGASGGLESGVDWSSSVDTSARSYSPGQFFHIHSVDNASGTNLVLAIAKSYDTMAPTSIGLIVNKTGGMGDNVVVASGSRYSQDPDDMKSIPFAIVQDMPSGTDIKIKNVDPQTVNTDYSYIFTLNLDDTPAINATGRLSSWTDHSTSGTWGTKTIDGNNEESFVIAMGRQLETGVQSGRMASISLLNNTSGDYLTFKERPSGNYNPLYYPATNPGVNVGQQEISVVVGVGKIGDADEIEVTTL